MDWYDMIRNNEYEKFKLEIEKDPNALDTYDYKERDDDEVHIDYFRVACSYNRVDMVRLIMELCPIYSDYYRIVTTICRKSCINVLYYFIDLIKKGDNKHKLVQYMDGENGLRYHGYNIALFYLEEEIVLLLKSLYKCRLYEHKNYPFFVHKEQMLALHNK
jgi:hypothetical protein